MIVENSLLPAPLAWLKSRFGGQPKAPFEVDRRVNRRERIRFKARIEGPANPGIVPVKGIDIHSQGAMVESERAWVTGETVWLELNSFQLAGFAVVRHCTRRKERGYTTGLEFRGPLKRHESGKWEIRRIRPSEDVWTSGDDLKLSGDLFKVA